jgi:hypothetical protein
VETTFTHEVKFISQVPNEGDIQKGILPFIEGKIITKTATFKELSRTDPAQRDISWLIMDIFDTDSVKKTKKKGITSHINPEITAEITDKFVNEMLVIDENVSEADKKELLADNGAMIQLGLWLVHNKFLNFFFALMKN